MRSILAVCAAVTASFALYWATFGFVLRKPLSVGTFERVIEKKVAYAQSVEGPKLVVSAGSNGFMSVRCETLEEELAVPCVNTSIALALGNVVIFEHAKRVLEPGDWILLPLEYRLYYMADEDQRAAISHAYALSYDQSILRALPPKRLAHALLYADLKYGFVSVVESVRYFIAGARHPFDEAGSLTAQGDIRGHDDSKSKRFESKLAKRSSSASQLEKLRLDAPQVEPLTSFLDWARSNGVVVVGTLPASVDSTPLEPESVGRLRSLYEGRDQRFVALGNLSQYPRSCFYDSVEHLRERCQIDHSRKLARALHPILAETGRADRLLPHVAQAPTP